MTEPFDLAYDQGSYQTLVARLDLFSETIVYTKFDGGLPVTCHEVSPYDLATAFTGLPLNTGILPANCLFYGRQGGQEFIGLYLEPAVRTLTVAGPIDAPLMTVTIPTPPLILVGEGTKYSVYAVKQRPGADDRLFHAPFPNVGTDGQVCAGTAEFPACTVGTMRRAALAFFESTFNDHLVKNKSKKHSENVLELWQELAGKKKYPLADLLPTSRLVSSLVGGAS